MTRPPLNLPFEPGDEDMVWDEATMGRHAHQDPPSRCWITTPCGGWGGESWVGYVWAVDLTQAKRLAIQTEPGGNGGFRDFRFRRRPDLDGALPAGRAAWDANELPPEVRHRAPDLWGPSTDL